MPPHHCPWPVGLADISAMFGVAHCGRTLLRWPVRGNLTDIDHPPDLPALEQAPAVGRRQVFGPAFRVAGQ
jgi:hypothetical protein